MAVAAAQDPAEGSKRPLPLRTLLVGVAAAIGAPGIVTILAATNSASGVPRVLYVAAVAVAAVFGGLVGGLLAVVLSALAIVYFVSHPLDELALDQGVDLEALIAFVAVGVVVCEAIARQRRARRREHEARQRAEAAAARTRRLEAVARALANARTPQSVLNAVLSEGLAAAEARAGLIAMLSEDGEDLEVVAQRGYQDWRIERWPRFSLDEQLPLAEAVRTGQGVYLPTTAERNRRYPLLADLEERSHALACLPLVFEGRKLGGLVFSFPADKVFTPEERSLKEALAAQAAQALDRARLDEAERELRERLDFLARASELLASSLDYERTLRQTAALAVPRLADWCVVDVVDEDGEIRRIAAVHRDVDKMRIAEEYTRRYPPQASADSGLARVIRTGEPELLPEIADDAFAEATDGDEERLRILRELGLRSCILVPLVVRGRALGALTLVASESGRRYDQADLELARDLARRAAVAVDNALLHREVEQRADAARALRHVADGVVLVDRSRVPRYHNEAARTLLGELLDDWRRVEDELAAHGSAAGGPVTIPLEIGGAERWLRISRVAFDEGRVYAIRDVTDERLLERTRSEFVATASHELRTPIAAVQGAFQTLLRPDVDLEPARVDQFLRMGLHEAERLARIADDLLLAGEVDRGSPRIAPESCDLSELIADVVGSLARRVDERYELDFAVDASLEPVECDPVRLRQVLANLIENAIKYSPDGGPVTVSAAPTGRRVRIEVADRGIGIPEADHARIFERFVRLDPSLSRGVNGTGLGLYICRELVRRMGGTIGVRSREGEGSTFFVELPRA